MIVAAWQWDVGAGLVVVLVIALFIGALNWRRDSQLRRIRFGVFLDRERFKDAEPFDDDDVDDDDQPTQEFERRWPSE